jgi:hypothetical protein
MSKGKGYILRRSKRSQAKAPITQLLHEHRAPHFSEDAVAEGENAQGRVLYARVRFSSASPPLLVGIGKQPRYTRETESKVDDQYGIMWNYEPNGESMFLVLNVGLQKLLVKHLAHYPGHWDEGIAMGRPFEPIIHNWDALRSLSEQAGADDVEKQALVDLRNLQREIQRSMKFILEDMKDIKRDKVVTFDTLWTMFPPGSIVYATPFGHPQCFLVSSTSYEVPKEREVSYFSDSDEEYVERRRPHLNLRCWTYGKALNLGIDFVLSYCQLCCPTVASQALIHDVLSIRC